MSEENVEVVVGVFEAVNSRDFAAALDAHAEEVALAFHGELRHLGGEEISGKKAVGEWFGDWYRQFGRDYRSEIEESRDLCDRVVVIATDYGRGRTSGAPIMGQIGYVYTVRGGKIVRCDVYPSREEALDPGAGGVGDVAGERRDRQGVHPALRAGRPRQLA
jgi:ketosteroid isomerase-like protein